LWHDLEREQEMLDRDVLVAELLHFVEGPVEHARQARRHLRLRGHARHGRLLREPRLRFGAELRHVLARALDEGPRQLLVEQRDQKVVRSELRIARAARQLLRSAERLLRLHRQAVEVHFYRP
jgi:hypothetical protein